jgi:hypothetical protein
VKMEIINVVMIINELGSPKAAIALLQVVHFHPSIYQHHVQSWRQESLPAFEVYGAGRYMAN